MTDPMAGQKLGKFELFEEIGEGGMGRVYRARHSLIGREAAIKVLRPKLSNDKEAVARFFNEARSTTMIHHPGIVDILDFGFAPDGRAFIVMELLEGSSLGQILKVHPRLPLATICRYMRQAAGALSAAHAVGIIHRDLKPDNLFVVADPEVVGGERVKLLDFGIAKLSGAAAQNVTKTATGAVLGSPLYMSPEQCAGSGGTGFSSDIYSLGCVMYELAVGRPPFNGTGVGAIIAMHIYERPMPPIALDPNTDRGLNDLILSLMEKDPTKRPASMDEVATALDRLSGNAYTNPMSGSARYANTGHRFPSARMAPTVNAAAIPVSLKQTTHGASSGQIGGRDVNGRSRLGWIAAAVVLIAAAVAAAVIIAQQSGVGESSENAAPVAARVVEKTPPSSEPRLDPVPAASVDRPPEDEITEITETVSFTITSEPAGALVRDSSRQLLGETPYTMTVDKRDAAEELILTRLGYDDASLSIPSDRDREEHVVLTAKKKSASSASKAERPAKPKKKKKKSGFGETINPLED